MRQLECEFDAMPELAAVVVDMNEEWSAILLPSICKAPSVITVTLREFVVCISALPHINHLAIM